MHSNFYRTVVRTASILLAFSLLFSLFSVSTAASPVPAELPSRANRGPEMVKDINTMNMSSLARDLTSAGDAFYFRASDGLHGDELWRSQGTPETTGMVTDLLPGAAGSYPNHITRLDENRVIFIAYDAANRQQIGVSDGTAEGTRFLTNLAYNVYFGSIDPISFGGQVYLVDSSNSLDQQRYLWRTDGTQANTTKLADYLSAFQEYQEYNQLGSMVAAFDGWLYFGAEGPNGRELYRTNPNTNEVVLVSDLCASTDDCGDGLGNASPYYLAAASDRLYFTAYDKDHGLAIWSTTGPGTDGTEKVSLAVDLLPGSGSQERYYQLTALGDDLYFIGPDGTNGRILWKLEVTPESPAGVLKKITGSDPLPPGSSFSSFKTLGNTLFFGASAPVGSYSVYRTTGNGVELINSTSGILSHSVQWGNALYFTQIINGSREIWSITENGASQQRIVELLVTAYLDGEIILWKDHLIFNGVDTVHGFEPWISDGTQAGTAMLADLNTQASDAAIYSPGIYQDAVYFEARAGFGTELWRSNGTAAGTEMLLPSESYHGFEDPVVSNDMLYFTDGRALWRSDGTQDGTFQTTNAIDMSGYTRKSLMDVNGTLFLVSGSLSRGQRGIRALKKGETEAAFISEKGGDAYQVGALGSHYITVGFTYGATQNHWDVVRSDGTAAGTEVIYTQDTTAPYYQLGYSPSSEHMVSFDGRLFFVAPGPEAAGSLNDLRYYALYATDGQTVEQITSAEGTPTFPVKPVVVGETLYFGAMNGTDSALWKLPKGTNQAQIVRTMAQGLNGYSTTQGPFLWADLNGKLVFSYGDLDNGLLWLSDGTPSGTAPLCPTCGYQVTTVRRPIIANGKLYFAAKNELGTELWVSDGTDAGTQLLGDLWPGPDSSNPSNFIVLGPWLLFSATDGTAPGTGHGNELWRYDLMNHTFLPMIAQNK